MLFERLSLSGFGSASSGRNEERARLLLDCFSVDDFLGLMYVMGWSESVAERRGKGENGSGGGVRRERESRGRGRERAIRGGKRNYNTVLCQCVQDPPAPHHISPALPKAKKMA